MSENQDKNNKSINDTSNTNCILNKDLFSNSKSPSKNLPLDDSMKQIENIS